MKTSLLFALVFHITFGAFAQGTINIGNTFGTVFRAPIYRIPARPTDLLQGTGYTFAVYFGPASVTDPAALTLLVSTTFRNGGAAGLIAPIPDVVVPGVAPGEQARLQVRAWDNRGGTLPTWELVTSDPFGPFNRSSMFLSGPLGGDTGSGVLLSPDMTGWESFSIIPEPSSIVLVGLAGLVFGVWRSRIKL